MLSFRKSSKRKRHAKRPGLLALRKPGTQAPGTQAPGTQTPGTQAPGTQAPETQAPETQEEILPEGESANTAQIEVANDIDFDDPKNINDDVIRHLLERALRIERTDLFLQPIMKLPQRQPCGYEVFTRIRAEAGLYLAASDYKEVAEQNKLLGKLESLMLMTCLQALESAQSSKNQAPYFINVSEETLTNPSLMKQLLEFLTKNRALAARLVFEFAQSDHQKFSTSAKKTLATLVSLGCRLSMDHVKKPDLNVEKLKESGITFIKLEAAWFIGDGNEETTLSHILALKDSCEMNGLALIAEKIENEDDMRKLIDYGLNFGQGFLLGRPEASGVYDPQTLRRAAS